MTDFKDEFNRWRLLKVYTREQNLDLGKNKKKTDTGRYNKPTLKQKEPKGHYYHTYGANVQFISFLSVC